MKKVSDLEAFCYTLTMSEPSINEYKTELKIIWDALVRQDDMPAYADVIVVGGCTDLGLAERTAELYHSNVSRSVVITGYQPDGLALSEAEILANECISLGVPKEVITLEEKSSNTGENIRFAANVVKNLNGNSKSIILVHKPYMSLRFLATAEAQWPTPQPTFYATCQSISFEEYCTIHGLEKIAWNMLGDMKRMREYVELDYQTLQQIPQAAYDAYEKIISSGFATR
jgi:uncharacterized SAM-binding protein YcdF (DUF218 family)